MVNTTVQIASGTESQRDKELPPALVEAIRDDPAAMSPVARVFAANVLYDMFRESLGYTPAQKKDFAELCAKLGDLLPKKDTGQPMAAASGYQLVINIGDMHRSITIEQPPAELQSVEDDL